MNQCEYFQTLVGIILMYIHSYSVSLGWNIGGVAQAARGINITMPYCSWCLAGANVLQQSN